MQAGATSFGGIHVAVPPNPPSPVNTGRTIGTSVAAALTTGVAVRVHEILEATYDGFLQITGAQRALLLKSLLAHCARWTDARDLIIEILGPPQPNQHVRQKDNVRRYLGYGAIDGNIILNCAADRATLWAVGNLAREQGHNFSLSASSSDVWESAITRTGRDCELVCAANLMLMVTGRSRVPVPIVREAALEADLFCRLEVWWVIFPLHAVHSGRELRWRRTPRLARDRRVRLQDGPQSPAFTPSFAFSEIRIPRRGRGCSAQRPDGPSRTSHPSTSRRAGVHTQCSDRHRARGQCDR